MQKGKVAKRKWLTGWVITVNGLVIFVLIAAAHNAYTTTNELHALLRAGKVPIGELLRDNSLRLVVILILLSGIVAEVKQSRLSLLVNPGFYLITFIWGIWWDVTYHGPHPEERVIGRILILAPLGIIATITTLLWLFYQKRASPAGVTNRPPPGDAAELHG